MSTLIFSPTTLSNILQTQNINYGMIAAGAGYAPSSIATYNGTLGPNILLEIYKGTKPTDFTGFTNVSSQVSNLLISFQCGAVNGGSACDFAATSTLFNYRVGKAYGYATNATATGTATWFILRRATLTPAAGAAGGVGDLTSLGAIMGTVGVTGSGADMEIDTTSIVNGNPYRSNGFIISFPITPYTV